MAPTIQQDVSDPCPVYVLTFRHHSHQYMTRSAHVLSLGYTRLQDPTAALLSIFGGPGTFDCKSAAATPTASPRSFPVLVQDGTATSRNLRGNTHAGVTRPVLGPPNATSIGGGGLNIDESAMPFRAGSCCRPRSSPSESTNLILRRPSEHTSTSTSDICVPPYDRSV